MKTIRTVVGVALAVGALALTGCAADPDLGDLESRLAEVDGVGSATAVVSHSGAPWNTQILVTLFLDDATDAAVAGAVRGAVPVLSADAEASRHGVSIGLLPGAPADYASASDRSAAYLRLDPETAGELGIDAARQFFVLSPDDLSRLAAGS